MLERPGLTVGTWQPLSKHCHYFLYVSLTSGSMAALLHCPPLLPLPPMRCHVSAGQEWTAVRSRKRSAGTQEKGT